MAGELDVYKEISTKEDVLKYFYFNIVLSELFLEKYAILKNYTNKTVDKNELLNQYFKIIGESNKKLFTFE